MVGFLTNNVSAIYLLSSNVCDFRVTVISEYFQRLPDRFRSCPKGVHNVAKISELKILQIQLAVAGLSEQDCRYIFTLGHSMI